MGKDVRIFYTNCVTYATSIKDLPLVLRVDITLELHKMQRFT